MLKKILVANRGEIALRVMRSAREMGIPVVAVYSEADRNALHVQYADEAVCIGPPPSSQSYLMGEKIIEVAKQTGADAIHPGYGFLSENASFAEAVENAGLIFIGPSAHSIRIMGSKLAAKEAVAAYDVPMIPGSPGAIEDPNDAISYAKTIGFPVLIKASAGGGGKGMRIVKEPSQLKEQMVRAVSEAKSAFGDGSVFVEKYFDSSKHIEIQILGDKHGNIVHLFERECSIQRRHQKVIEEAPSAVVSHELRMEMGAAAVNVAKSCQYHGAGTVEFLVDEELNYYFLEMNTRLQVEHPVTENITGIDLVKEQIKIASGEKLSFKQDDIKLNGHSMELRVYAEDPANNFLPDTGTLSTYRLPNGNGVRVDSGFAEGMEIPIYYDPLIAKLVTYGSTRKDAADRMVRAISEYRVSGIQTTLEFGSYVMQHPEFLSGRFTTKFVEEFFDPAVLNTKNEEERQIAAMLAAELSSAKTKRSGSSATVRSKSKWKQNRLH